MVGGVDRRDWLVHWTELYSMISDSASTCMVWKVPTQRRLH